MPSAKELAVALLKAVNPLLQSLGSRIKALEDRQLPKVLSEEEVLGIVEEVVKNRLREMPQIEPTHGKDGRDGVDGKDGAPGEPGRDALVIEILPTIDLDRSYARGTYASWRGGVIRAARTTDYLDTLKDGETVETKGWQIILTGLAEQSVEQKGERDFVLRSVDTAGRVVEKVLSVPVMIYRGVWREGSYQKGDTCTWAGSLWHCDEPTSEKPGMGKGWRLAVKRGADGKDLK